MEKQKEHRSTVGCYLYMVRTAAGVDRFYPAKLLGYIISGLSLPLAASLLPAAAVALLAQESSAPVYLVAMGCMALVYGGHSLRGSFWRLTAK